MMIKRLHLPRRSSSWSLRRRKVEKKEIKFKELVQFRGAATHAIVSGTHSIDGERILA